MNSPDLFHICVQEHLFWNCSRTVFRINPEHMWNMASLSESVLIMFKNIFRTFQGQNKFQKFLNILICSSRTHQELFKNQ